jgi:hypothetical protein
MFQSGFIYGYVQFRTLDYCNLGKKVSLTAVFVILFQTQWLAYNGFIVGDTTHEQYIDLGPGVITVTTADWNLVFIILFSEGSFSKSGDQILWQVCGFSWISVYLMPGWYLILAPVNMVSHIVPWLCTSIPLKFIIHWWSYCSLLSDLLKTQPHVAF